MQAGVAEVCVDQHHLLTGACQGNGEVGGNGCLAVGRVRRGHLNCPQRGPDCCELHRRAQRPERLVQRAVFRLISGVETPGTPVSGDLSEHRCRREPAEVVSGANGVVEELAHECQADTEHQASGDGKGRGAQRAGRDRRYRYIRLRDDAGARDSGNLSSEGICLALALIKSECSRREQRSDRRLQGEVVRVELGQFCLVFGETLVDGLDCVLVRLYHPQRPGAQKSPGKDVCLVGCRGGVGTGRGELQHVGAACVGAHCYQVGFVPEVLDERVVHAGAVGEADFVLELALLVGSHLKTRRVDQVCG